MNVYSIFFKNNITYEVRICWFFYEPQKSQHSRTPWCGGLLDRVAEAPRIHDRDNLAERLSRRWIPITRASHPASGAYDQGHCRLRFSLGSSCQRCPIKVLEKGCTLQDMKCALPILQARIQQGRGIQDISWYFCLSSESFKRIGALESRQGSKGFELTPHSVEVLLLLLPKPNIGTNTSAGLHRIEMPWG